MTDEAPQIEDTPTTTDTQADVDWQKRYLDLQPEYTRTTQELASIRKLLDGEDPDQLKEILSKYGYEIEDQAEPDEDEDPDLYEDEAEEDPRVAAHDQWIREQQQAQQQQAVNQQWDGWQQFIAEKAGDVELRQADINHLRALSVGNDLLPVAPAQAEKILAGYLEEREQWLESQLAARKTKPRVPHVPAGGQPPGEGKDPADMTRQERQQYMLERLRAESA